MKKLFILLIFVFFAFTLYGNESLIENEESFYSINDRTDLNRNFTNDRNKLLESFFKKSLKRSKDLIARKYDRLINPFKEHEIKQREEYIKTLRLFTLRYPNSKITPSAMLRLAELYYEYDGDMYLRSMGRYEKLLDLYDTGRILQKPELPKKDFSRSIKLYKEVVKKFPNYKLLDLTYYLIGYCYQEMEMPREGEQGFENLIKVNKKSVLAAESYFRIGEYFFDPPGDVKPDVHKAIDNYKKVLLFKKEVTFYDKALYKLGWSYYRLNNYPTAITYFVRVVDYYNRLKKSGKMRKKGSSDVYKESLSYIAISFAEWKGLEGLINYLKDRKDTKFKLEVFKKLGDVYFDRTEYDKALKVYYYFLKHWQYDILALQVQKKIMKTYERKNDVPNAVEAREKLVSRFGPGSEWYEKNSDNPRLEKISGEMSEKILLEYSTYHHANGQKDNSKKEYDLAIKGYNKFLTMFPTSKHSAEVQFNIAEIYYSMGKFLEASKYYLLVTQNIVVKENPFLSDAAFSLVMCFDQLLRNEEPVLIKKQQEEFKLKYANSNTYPVKATSPNIKYSKNVTGVSNFAKKVSMPTTDEEWLASVPFPKDAERLIKACNYFLKLLPTNKKSARVIYVAGQTYYRFGLYTNSRTELMKVVDYYPHTTFAREAVKTIVNSFDKENKYGELAKWAKNVELREDFADPEMKKFFAKVVGSAMFKEAVKVEQDKKKIIAAVDKYLNILKRYPNSPIAYKAMYNAARDYEKAGQYIKAIEMYKELIKKYPGNEFEPSAYFQIAYDYDSIMDFNNAVNSYLLMARKFPKDKSAKAALMNAAWFEYRLERWVDAAKIWQEYISRYNDSKEVKDYLWRIAECYEKADNWKKSESIYLKYLSIYKDDVEKEVDLYYKLAKHYEVLGKIKEKNSYFERIVKIHNEQLEKNNKEIGNSYVAEYEFYNSLKVFNKYEAIKLRLPQKIMGKLMLQKKKMMPNVIKLFINIISYKDPNWSTAALYMLGRVYSEFANMLFDAPVPRGLSEEEEGYYREELENAAYPLEDKATEYYQKAVKLAEDKGVDNRWIRDARMAVHKFDPSIPVYVLKVKPLPAYGKLFPVYGPLKIVKKEKKVSSSVISLGDIKVDPLNIREFRRIQALDSLRKQITYTEDRKDFIENNPFLKNLKMVENDLKLTEENR